MSRSRILPSFSSSRQMMMAWKVSGLSHRPAIIASRPASMRLAMAISPSRDSSSTEPISRRYMRTGSSVRSAGSEVRVATAVARGASTSSPPLGLLLLGGLRPPSRPPRLPRLSTTLMPISLSIGVDVLDLVGGDFLGRQHGVQFVMGDEAALLGDLDHPLDGGVGQVEQRAVGGFDDLRLRLPLSARRFSPCRPLQSTVRSLRHRAVETGASTAANPDSRRQLSSRSAPNPALTQVFVTAAASPRPLDSSETLRPPPRRRRDRPNSL